MFKKLPIGCRILRNQKGQSATEYMLLIAVIVLGLVAAASKIIPIFEDGVNGLGTNISETLKTNQEMTKASQ